MVKSMHTLVAVVVRFTWVGAFPEKLVGQNDPLTGCSAMLRYKIKRMNAEMSTSVTVLHC